MLAEPFPFSLREAARRWVAPLLARIPDVSGLPRRRMMAVGAGVSALVHLLLLLLFAFGTLVFPKKVDPAAPSETPAPAPLEVQLMPRPDKQIAAAPEPKRTELLNLRGLEKPEEKPDHPDFEADRDMVAASEAPPTGLLPMPSQEGRTDLPSHDFATQEVQIGLSKPQPPPSPAAPAAPPVSPMYKPQPVAREALTAAEKAKPVDELPEPAKPLRATPPPLRLTEHPDASSLEIARATPEPKTKPKLRDDPQRETPVATPMEIARLTPPSPAQPAQPAQPPSITSRYVESLQKSRIEGNVSNRGKNGMNVVNTPMGRYHRRMCQQIESLWQLKTHEHPDLLNLSTVRVRYFVQPSGRVTGIEVLDNGGDRRHADICVEAIRQLKLDPLPPEAAPMLNEGALEMVFSFTLF